MERRKKVSQNSGNYIIALADITSGNPVFGDLQSDYMIKEMEISEEESNMFISFLVEQDSLQAVLDTQNENRITFFLHDEWLHLQALRFSKT